jgi:hypothetical protein
MGWIDRIKDDINQEGWRLTVHWLDHGGQLDVDQVVFNGAGRVIGTERESYRDLTYDEALDVIDATAEVLRRRPLPF